MPLYEYVCQECSHPFETLVFGNEEVQCPSCHGHKLARQLSLPALCNSSGPPCGPACSRFNK